jgi:hypothetical protein
VPFDGFDGSFSASSGVPEQPVPSNVSCLPSAPDTKTGDSMVLMLILDVTLDGRRLFKCSVHFLDLISSIVFI